MLDYIALVSVISSAIVSVASLYGNYKSQREIERIRAAAEMAQLRQSHWNMLDSERRKQQAELLERIVAESVAVDSGRTDRTRELLKYLIRFRATMKGNPRKIDMLIQSLESECSDDGCLQTMMIVNALASELNDYQNDPESQQHNRPEPPQQTHS